jgi:hypothetical protein
LSKAKPADHGGGRKLTLVALERGQWHRHQRVLQSANIGHAKSLETQLHRLYAKAWKECGCDYPALLTRARKGGVTVKMIS